MLTLIISDGDKSRLIIQALTPVMNQALIVETRKVFDSDWYVAPTSSDCKNEKKLKRENQTLSPSDFYSGFEFE